MKVKNTFKSFGNAWMAHAVLIAGLVFAVAATFFSRNTIETRAKAEFALVCNDIKAKIDSRLHAHAQLLRTGAAFFAASDTVTRKAWNEFINQAKIDKNLPGVQGVGFATVIPKNQLQQHIQRIRNEGFPDYTLKPAGERSVYTSIIYLEPFTGRNLRAFGFDMLSEPIRRKAMEISRDNDIAALSGKVQLVQETNQDVQSGTLMYVPVYTNGMPVNTIQQRRAAIKGWVYSPYRMNDLMHGILGRWDDLVQGRIHLQVYDDSVSVASLLFDSQKNDTLYNNDSPLRTLYLPIAFNDTKWVVCFSENVGQILYFDFRVILVFVGGIIISFLLFVLFLMQIKTKTHAEKIAGKLTVDLKESETKFKTVADFTYNWEYWEGNDGRLNYISPSCQRISGYTPEEFLADARLLKTIVHPDDVKVYDEHYRKVHSIEHRNETDEIDFRIIKKDGSLAHISHVCAPVFDDDRNYLGRRISNRDITERKRAEHLLKDIIDKNPTSIQIVDKEGFTLSVNPAFSEIFGSVPPLGFSIFDDLQNKGFEKYILLARSGEVVHLPDMYYNAKDGVAGAPDVPVWIRAVIFSLKDSDGKPERFVLMHENITLPKKAEADMRRITERLNEAQEIGNIGSFSYDAAANINYLSPQMEKIFGFKPGQMKDAMAWSEILHPLDREAMEAFVADCLQKGIPYDHDYRIIRDGQTRWLRGIARAEMDAKGKIVRLSGINIDITFRKLAEAALSISETRYRRLFESAKEGILILDAESGMIKDVNPFLMEMLGYSKAQFIEKAIWEIGFFRDLIANKDKFTELQQNEYVRYENLPLETATGKRINVEFVSNLYLVSNQKVIQCNIRDITERRIADEALKRSEDKYRILFETMPNGFYRSTPEGYFVDANPALLKMLGYDSLEELCKVSIPTDIYVKPEEREDFYRENEGFVDNLEFYRLKAKDGRIISIEDNARYIKDEHGKIMFHEGICRDITERKEAEQVIKQKNEELQKLNATKDKFFSIIAHDLKSPFNSIMGFSELLIEQVGEKNYTGVEKYSKIILNSSNRAMDLLMNLMDWSRSQTGRMEFSPEYFELVDFLGEVLMMFEDIVSQKSVIIVKDMPFKVAVFADRAMINTVIRNLVSNAIKFTRPGGQIIITATEKHNEILVSVKDNGVGIPRDMIGRLFRIDENYTTAGTNNERGTGLGLILCKEFIEKHGGKIWVESVENKGSVFAFTLPSYSENVK